MLKKLIYYFKKMIKPENGEWIKSKTSRSTDLSSSFFTDFIYFIYSIFLISWKFCKFPKQKRLKMGEILDYNNELK